MKQDIFQQIKYITRILLLKSLQVSDNFPKYSGKANENIIWEQYQNLAFKYKNEPYETIFNETKKAKDYNFRMFDDAIVQMQYEFMKNSLVKHTLSYLPNPNIEGFKDEQDYEDRFFSSTKLFSDMVDKKIIVFPIRFDYSQDFTDCEHPFVHTTFGNYESCRIPVAAPISPNRFILFILRSFYFEKFSEIFEEDFKEKSQKEISLIESNKKLSKEAREKEILRCKNEFLNSLFACKLKFERTISNNEEKMIHFNYK